MTRPYKLPAYRVILYKYTVEYVSVDKEGWFNRRKSHTRTIVAPSRYHVWDELYWWEWGNCYHIKKITLVTDD